MAIFFYSTRKYYKNRVKVLFNILSDFKKGKFIITKRDIRGDDELSEILKELITMGKHIDNIISSQKNEIDKFYELYNSLIFSMNSYFVVLDEGNKVVFATEGFWKKFQFDHNEISGKKIDEIFYFLNARLIGGIFQAHKFGKAVYLEKIHLLSQNKISIIADIKISNIIIQGKTQIIIIIDDITNKLRKDYQISLMHQINDSIQRNVDIDRVLYSILTGVTSGSGLGFNRAMLFLLDQDGDYLVGKMAVGPDSFEEAIQVWSSSPSAVNLSQSLEQLEINTGKNLLNKVLAARIPLKNKKNIFVKTLQDRKEIHIFDSWENAEIDSEMRDFMDVKEFIIIPLIVGTKTIGIIVADNKFNKASIGNESVELLNIFASQAALSIESYSNLAMVRTEMEKISEKQDAMVESEKLAAVGRIAAHISHEIRNPLVTMGGYARRIMQISKDHAKSENINKAAQIILKESERLEKILSNVMDFTRPTKYIKDFNNINDVVQDTVDLLRNIFLEKKIDLKLTLNKDLPLVKSDFNQLKQVMLNLLQNSLDVTPGDGSIYLTTTSDNEFVTISLKDDGTGIEEEDPNVIFEPFFTTKVTGVGLGLAIVKKIIKDHNGEITVRNRDDKGVEFIIRLPIPT
jgi:signal transduction histidine kinase